MQASDPTGPRTPQTTGWGPVVATLTRTAPVVLLLAVTAAVATFSLASRSPEHRVVGRIIVAPDPAAVGSAAVESVRVLTMPGVLGSLAELLNSGSLLNEVTTTISDGRPDPGDYDVEASVVQESMVLEISATGPSEAVAVRLVEGLMEAGGDRFTELYPLYRLDVLDQPIPAEPTVLPAWQLAVVAGLGTAFLASWLMVNLVRLRRSASRPGVMDAPTPQDQPTPVAGSRPVDQPRRVVTRAGDRG